MAVEFNDRHDANLEEVPNAAHRTVLALSRVHVVLGVRVGQLLFLMDGLSLEHPSIATSCVDIGVSLVSGLLSRHFPLTTTKLHIRFFDRWCCIFMRISQRLHT
jgi:hypothetical protein